MEKIKIENLTFSYPAQKKPALENVNLIINSGEFVVLCGKSGCGKSTLLRQLKPVLSPHGSVQGKILFDGKDISELPQRQQAEKIGFVLQNPDSQIVCDKVWHELAFGLENLSYSNAEIRSRVAEMAAYFGIQGWFYKNVSELSGGQKQLLNLASVMAMQPEILILDEPTAQLDPIAARDFLETVSRINKELGTAILISEHRLEEVFPLADRVVVMDSGKIAAHGSPREVGQALWTGGSDMFCALPTPMRVYYSVQDGAENCPITVRDGRKWLFSKKIKENISFENTDDFGNKKTAAELKNVYFRYEKNSPDVLNGLSLKIYENEIYAIVGGNGAGKTTALSVIGKINEPYAGKVEIAGGKRVVTLMQNPQCMFSHKTVLLDLQDAAADITAAGGLRENQLKSVIRLCELNPLLQRHPYDLSGGEQQRAALAAVLLRQPDILLLDEPTKGLDVAFKSKLAEILKRLCNSGMTVVMVSHDIEFCARYADRCGMFFDGQIVSEQTPRRFFSEKCFYTTAANRMAQKIIDGAVLDTDIMSALGAAVPKTDLKPLPAEKMQENILPENENRKVKHITKKNVIFGTVFAVLFFITLYICFNFPSIILQAANIIFLGLACFNFIPQKEFNTAQIPSKKQEISKRTRAGAIAAFCLVPFTIFAGIYYMGDKKYLFISLLIMLETMLPFAMIFEGRKPQARELVIISVLCAIAVAGRTAFAATPQFKPVIALVIISGICFGGETGFLVGTITGFVSNFYLSQGPWTPWQMFSFGIVGFLAGVLAQKGILRKTRLQLCVFGFAATVLVYGGIMNPASVIMWQPKPTFEMIATSYAAGLPFDLVHGMSTVLFLWFAAEPMCEKLDRIKLKYGLM